MNVAEAISKRRSIRKYSSRPVSYDVIRDILEAGRLAPSGCNAQPTRYILVTSQEAKENLRANRIFAQDWVYKAPLIIVYCGNPAEYNNPEGIKFQQAEGTLPRNIGEISDYFGQPDKRLFKDLSISSAFTVLRATELELGTCYVGLINRANANKVLGIPQEYIIPFALTVGYRAEEPSKIERKKLDELILRTI